MVKVVQKYIRLNIIDCIKTNRKVKKIPFSSAKQDYDLKEVQKLVDTSGVRCKVKQSYIDK